MNRSTWLIARAIWVAFAIVFLVFFGLELVFRVLDEAKLPHTNYTAERSSACFDLWHAETTVFGFATDGIDCCRGGAWWSGAIE